MNLKYSALWLILFALMSGSCEELGLDVRKLELTINGKIRQIETVDTWNAAFDVRITRNELLDFFDIDNNAEVSNFRLRSLELYYQPCEAIEAESVEATLFVEESSGSLSAMAKWAGIDLKNGIKKNVRELGQAHEFKLASVFGGISSANGILKGMIDDPTKFLRLKLESVHAPVGSLVCGAILIRLDVYIVYKECRAVPFGSKAGEACD